jgi:hypothetical protein
MSRTTSVNLGNGASVMLSRPPTLFANVDQPLLHPQQGLPGGGGTLDLTDVNDSPRVAATGTVTIGGSVTENDVTTVTIGGVAHAYTTLSTPNVSIVADGVAAAINAGTVATATTVLGVVNITARAAGIGGNTLTLTSAVVGVGTAVASAATLSGGTGPIIALDTFEFSYLSGQGAAQTFYFREGRPYFPDAGLLAALVADGAPIG